MIALVEQAGLALALRGSHPAVADQNQNRVGLADLTLNLRLEVFPCFDGIHVEEYILGSEQMAEPVIESASRRCRVGAPVADEDLLVHLFPSPLSSAPKVPSARRLSEGAVCR